MAARNLIWNNRDPPLANREVKRLFRFESWKGDTCAGGKAALPLPGLSVEGVGRIAFPLLPIQAEALKTVAMQAPCGKGMHTVVDVNIRKSLQIEAAAVTMTNRSWDIALQSLVHNACRNLGIDGKFVESSLYKLLLYEKGGFFKPHKDTEKVSGMFGTLVVQFPSEFTGGAFIVRHGGNERVFQLGGNDSSSQNEFYYVAHYADCEHEIREVTSGFRLAAVYSLSWKGMGPPPSIPSVNAIYTMVRGLVRLKHGVGLFLSHQYTPASLCKYGVRALKGRDRDIADSLLSASAILKENDPDNEVVLHIASAERVDSEFGNGWDDASFEPHETEKGIPKFDKKELYSADGSAVTSSALSILDILSFVDVFKIDPEKDGNADEREDESGDDSDESFDDEDEDDSDFWPYIEHENLEVTGNEGATRETKYSCYILTIWTKRGEQGILWKHKLPAEIEFLQVVSPAELADKMRRILPRVQSVLHSEEKNLVGSVGLRACESLLAHCRAIKDRFLAQDIIDMLGITWIRLRCLDFAGDSVDPARTTGDRSGLSCESMCLTVSLVDGFKSSCTKDAVIECVKCFGTSVLSKSRSIIDLDVSAAAGDDGLVPAAAAALGDGSEKYCSSKSTDSHEWITVNPHSIRFYMLPTLAQIAAIREARSTFEGHRTLARSNTYETDHKNGQGLSAAGLVATVHEHGSGPTLNTGDESTELFLTAADCHESLFSVTQFVEHLPHDDLLLAMFCLVLKVQSVSVGSFNIPSSCCLLRLATDLGRADMTRSALSLLACCLAKFPDTDQNQLPSSSRSDRTGSNNSGEDIYPFISDVNVAVLNAVRTFGWPCLSDAVMSLLAAVAAHPADNVACTDPGSSSKGVAADGHMPGRPPGPKGSVRFLDGRLRLVMQLVDALLPAEDHESLNLQDLKLQDLCRLHFECLIYGLGQEKLPKQLSATCMDALRFLLSLPGAFNRGGDRERTSQDGRRLSDEPEIVSELRTCALKWAVERQNFLLDAIHKLEQGALQSVTVQILDVSAGRNGENDQNGQKNTTPPRFKGESWAHRFRIRANGLRRAVYAERADAASSRLRSLGPEPAFSFAMPDAVFPACSAVQAFLRGPAERLSLGGHGSIMRARKMAQQIVDVQQSCSGRWCMTRESTCRFTATATAHGSGGNAFVEIVKTRRYFETRLKPWLKAKAELQAANALLASVPPENPQPEAMGAALLDTPARPLQQPLPSSEAGSRGGHMPPDEAVTMGEQARKGLLSGSACSASSAPGSGGVVMADGGPENLKMQVDGRKEARSVEVEEELSAGRSNKRLCIDVEALPPSMTDGSGSAARDAPGQMVMLIIDDD